jgi:hypothetical protein
MSLLTFYNSKSSSGDPLNPKPTFIPECGWGREEWRGVQICQAKVMRACQAKHKNLWRSRIKGHHHQSILSDLSFWTWIVLPQLCSMIVVVG